MFVLMISMSILKLGYLWPIFHGPVTVKFFHLVQFLSKYWSYSSHPYLTVTYISQSIDFVYCAFDIFQKVVFCLVLYTEEVNLQTFITFI